jgi:hypothetical protein
MTMSVERDLPAPEREARTLKASPYPAVLGKGLLAVARMQTARWDRAMKHVREEQEKALVENVQHARNTEFGRRRDFAGIKSYADFVSRVPLGDYDSHSPFIERMRKGERNVLVDGFVRYFGNSSGSSTQGRSKFLPISDRQIAHCRRAGANALMRWLAHANDDEFMAGYSLGLFPPTTMREEGPVLITSNPALMVTKLPVFTKPVYLPHDDIRKIASYEEKLEKIAERYLDWDIRSVAGTTCWFTLLFEKVLEAAKKRDPGIRHVRDVWPNLRVLIGGGVSADPYLPIIRSLVGRNDIALIDSYNATEGGIYATTDFTGARGMLMMPHHGTFFEFIAMDERGNERGKPNAKRVPLWEVETDRNYSIVVTTASGLYAYELGDIVRFPSVNPLRVEFAGRLNGCLSVTQELTTHVEIERAVAYAIAKCPSHTVDFGASADVGAGGTAKSRYALWVEFAPGQEPESMTAFAAAFDEGLCKENRVYREHRNGDVAIVAPRVVPLVKGGAQRFMHEITNGNVQGKFPRIIDDARKAKLAPYARESSP